MLATPPEPHLAALLFERVLGRRLEVLPYYLLFSACVQPDAQARDHSGVAHVGDRPALDVVPVNCLAVAEDADLLGPDGELVSVALQRVRNAYESGYKEVGRFLVDLVRWPDLLDAALVEDGQPVAHRERLLL